jgi:hypothetical protein
LRIDPRLIAVEFFGEKLDGRLSHRLSSGCIEKQRACVPRQDIF